MIGAIRYKVRPANSEFYLNRCYALEDCLKHVDRMPVFLVVFNCYSVMHRALGNDWKVLVYVTSTIAGHLWSRIQSQCFWTWHLYIRCRSHEEIREIIDQQLERMTGEDHREWPDIVTIDTQEQAND